MVCSITRGSPRETYQGARFRNVQVAKHRKNLLSRRQWSDLSGLKYTATSPRPAAPAPPDTFANCIRLMVPSIMRAGPPEARHDNQWLPRFPWPSRSRGSLFHRPPRPIEPADKSKFHRAADHRLAIQFSLGQLITASFHCPVFFLGVFNPLWP